MSSVELIRVFGEGTSKTISFAAHDLNDVQVSRQISRDLRLVMGSDEFLAQTDDPRLNLDFKDVGWISSAALNELIRLNSHARSRGIRLVLMDVCDEVREVFVLTRLERMFEFDSSAASA